MKKGCKMIIIASLLAAWFAFPSCTKKNETAVDKTSNAGSVEIKKEDKAVCIIEGASLWKTPGKGKDNWLSSLSLGEMVVWLNESKVDTADNNREYIKVGLSDGKIGWVSSYCVLKDAEAGAIKEDAPIYKRPDLLTITPKKLSSMDIVAVLQTKDGLSEIVGENQKNKGWVKSELITTNKEDVTVAILANKKFKENPKTPKEMLIKDIIENTPYPNSYFIGYLKREIDMDDSDLSTTNSPNGESTDSEASGE